MPPSTTSFENIGGRRKKKKLDFDPIAAMLGQTPAGEPSAVGLGVPARSSLKQPELSEEEKEPEEEKVEEKGEKKSKMRYLLVKTINQLLIRRFICLDNQNGM